MFKTVFNKSTQEVKDTNHHPLLGLKKQSTTKRSISPASMKPASVIGAVIQTHSLFDWQFDLSPEALPNCSATQVVLASEKAVAYSYKSHQSHGGNPSPKKPILQCQDHVLASTCSTSQDTAPLYSCQM